MESESRTFKVSGYPNYLEWYRCYEDPSKDHPMDGMEFLDNRERWSERENAKWNFFYQPVRGWVGRPQKALIRKRKAGVATARSRLRMGLKSLSWGLFLSLIVLLASLRYWQDVAFLPILFAGFKGVKFYLLKRSMTKLILQWEQDIAALRQEIEVLKGLLPSVPDTSQVEQWLKEEMQALERSCLAEIVNVSPAEETLFDCIRHSPIESGDHNRYDLHGLLIEGWGPVQPEVFKGPFGKERTGIHRVVRDIGTNVATFRVGSRAQPMNRVAYLQFVFLLQNNINVYGFFYDFITGVQYGKRSETFQYSHVTNYSIREVEADEDRLIRQVDLPPALARSVFGREVSAFFLAVSSGSHFQCVLTDDTLVNGINEWLKVDSEFRKKQQELIDRSELKDEYQKGFTMAESEMGNLGEKARRALGKHVGSDDTLVEEWAREERRDLEEALLEVDARRRFLEDRRIHVARRVLQQIRQEIEDFVAGAAGRRQEGAL